MLINHTTGEIAYHFLRMKCNENGDYLGLEFVQYPLKNPEGDIEMIYPKFNFS